MYLLVVYTTHSSFFATDLLIIATHMQAHSRCTWSGVHMVWQPAATNSRDIMAMSHEMVMGHQSCHTKAVASCIQHTSSPVTNRAYEYKLIAARTSIAKQLPTAKANNLHAVSTAVCSCIQDAEFRQQFLMSTRTNRALHHGLYSRHAAGACRPS